MRILDRGGRRRNVRERLVALFVGMMALSLLLVGGISYAVQHATLSDRVDQELRQEVRELQEIAVLGPDLDGQPYTDVRDLFYAFLRVSIPGDDESFMGVIDGQASLVPGGERRFEINDDEVLEALSTLQVPEGRARTMSLRTQGTELRILAADVQLPEETRRATFVVANDIGRQRAAINRQLGTFVLISLGTMALAGVIGGVVIGRLLRPLQELREATAEISTENLTRRLEVAKEDTDVAELAGRFNDMLDRIDEGVREQRQFLDDAAHELRTPLTIIRGNAELMSPDDPEDVRSSQALVLAEVDRMQRLVDDLLMLARSQRPDFITPSAVEVTELAVEAMERITALGERSWRLRADADGLILADAQRLTQAIIQLAANAVKFSEDGSQVELATRWVGADAPEAESARAAGADEAPRYLAISVKDQGRGIPEREIERVMSRFGRAGNAEGVEGFGLGLAIVDAISRAHGGSVGVESLEGVGSIFTIWLPAEDETAG